MKKLIQIWLLITVFLLQTGPALAQFRKVGTTGYVFLAIPVSARMAAMGETCVALPGLDANGLFSNPALLAFTAPNHTLSLTHANYLAETRHQAIGYVMRRPGIGVFGVSVNRLDLGEMTETINANPDNPGGRYIVTGQYSAGGLAAGLSYAFQPTNWFAFGLTTRYVREQIANFVSDNFLLDLGMLYYTRFHSLRIGGFIQNFGVDGKYIGDTFKMPMIFRLGAAMEVWGKKSAGNWLTLALDALHPSDYSERLHLGAEAGLQNLLTLRTGYKFNYDEEGWTAGIGLKWLWQKHSLGLDLAFTDYGRLKSVLRLSLNIGFDFEANQDLGQGQ